MSRMSVLLVIAVIIFACSQPVQAQKPLQLTMDANNVWVRAGELPILQYRYDSVPFKPYVKELYTPNGVNFLLDAPSDHLHHHALMYAVAVDGVNFWEETSAAGYEKHDGFAGVWANAKDGAACAGFRETVQWIPAKDRPCSLLESRRITACRVPQVNATVLAWQSDFELPKDSRQVTLSGSHYFGLGLRFVRSMDGSVFFNADGKEGTIFRGEEKLTQSNWCAYSAPVDGKPVTVAMLGHPTNPRPTTWFTMAKPFAYVSATLNLHAEPLVVRAEKPLVLQYAVVAWDGKVDAKEIDRAYQWYIKNCRQIHGPVEGAEQDEERK
ncbi:MAG TPA: PmoA family protein [Sedimentisphaerales bacterium]|jgi:hypothetical protein|nr:PmoA family protein [Sedimentisphaerales bacterium]HNU31692.1 PmoA family protein [Sedimentisphaerales bacterium]